MLNAFKAISWKDLAVRHACLGPDYLWPIPYNYHRHQHLILRFRQLGQYDPLDPSLFHFCADSLQSLQMLPKQVSSAGTFCIVRGLQI